MILMFSGPLEFHPTLRGTSHSPSWAHSLLCLSPDPPHTSRTTPAVDTPAHTFKHFHHPLRHPSGLAVCPLSAGRPSSGSGPWAIQVGSSGVPGTKQRSRMAEGVRESQVGPPPLWLCPFPVPGGGGRQNRCLCMVGPRAHATCQGVCSVPSRTGLWEGSKRL